MFAAHVNNAKIRSVRRRSSSSSSSWQCDIFLTDTDKKGPKTSCCVMKEQRQHSKTKSKYSSGMISAATSKRHPSNACKQRHMPERLIQIVRWHISNSMLQHATMFLFVQLVAIAQLAHGMGDGLVLASTSPANIWALENVTVLGIGQQQHELAQKLRELAAHGSDIATAETGSKSSGVRSKASAIFSEVASSDGHSIMKYINRDNILDRHHSNSRDNDAVAGNAGVTFPTTATFGQQFGSVSTCPSCQLREKAKRDNLESIKAHILMRLHLTTLPNITAPVTVPQNIIRNFYRNFSISGGRHQNSKKLHSYARDSSRDSASASTSGGMRSSQVKGRNYHYQQVGEQFEEPSDISDYGASSSVNIDIQSDDPFAYRRYHNMDIDAGERDDDASDYFMHEDINDKDDYDESADGDDDELYDEFFSRQQSIYVFPTTPRMRHNRKPEILNFKFNNEYSRISRVVMHIYIRGREWMREHDPLLIEQQNADGATEHRQVIAIVVHRAIHCANSLNCTHTVKLIESHHKIPAGLGQWVQIELNPLASYWSEHRNMTLGIVIKSSKAWMRPFIVTGDSTQNKPYTIHIEISTQDKRRRKRSTSLDCQESDHEVRCCRYPLKVNFTNFGWHFVVAPTSFDAYFCNGECKVGYLEQYTHTHLTSLTTSATPCCSPTKMNPLSLLYFNLDQNLVLSTIPNMSVEKCSCS